MPSKTIDDQGRDNTDHVPAQKPLEGEQPPRGEHHPLGGGAQHPAPPEHPGSRIEHGADSTSPHTVPVLHIPNELELLKRYIEILPLELRTEFVFVELLLPL